MNVYDFLITFIQFTLPPITTLLAGVYGVKYGLKQFREQKKIEIIENQLNKFYSPLLALHEEIKSKGQVRFKIHSVGDVVWQKRDNQNYTDNKQQEKQMEFVDKEIDYNNRQLETELLPLYAKMLDIFRENFWLAEPETVKYYYDIVEFVEIWKRWLLKTIDPEVAKELKSEENKLLPFYEELENRTNILRNKMIK